MKPFFFLLFLFIISMGCSSPRTYIYLEDGNAIPAEVLRDHEKSTVVGVLLTIFPGIIWHGVGHRYAGDIEKAEQIEQFELYSLIAGGVSAGFYYAGEEARKENLNALKVSLYISSGTFAGFGGISFLGSWLYDLIFTPSAIQRHNRKLYSTGQE